MAIKLFVANDNLITWNNMTSSVDGSYVNDATVTMTLYDSTGATVTGAIAVSLPYVSASNGKYQGTIDSTVALVSDASYTLKITAVSGTKNGFVELDCVAVTRTS